MLREAISEAMAPLHGVTVVDAPSNVWPVKATAAQLKTDATDPWALVPLPTQAVQAELKAVPAPAPADLAALRSWLHNDAA